MNCTYTYSRRKKIISKDSLKRTLFFILISLIILQQMPVIKELLYNQIRIVLYFGFGIFSLISCFSINQFINIRFVRYFIFTLIYTLILFLIINLFNVGELNIFELLIPFGILICSLNTNFCKKQLTNVLLWYILLSMALGISSIFYYGEGFTITRTYFLAGKNQIGPLLGISTIITGIWILTNDQLEFKFNNTIFKILIFFLLISSILIIRNRSGLLGIFIVSIAALFVELKFKKTIRNILMVNVIMVVLIILFVLGAFDGLIETIFKSIFLNYDIRDLNSISAGRVIVYIQSLEFITQYPVLGELGIGNFITSTPHNYILNKWVNLGVIGSLPLVLFYLYLWLFTFKSIIKSKKIKFTLPIWVLFFSLIVSVFEYTYPYGPGVSQLMVWFLLGQYFRYLSGKVTFN